MILNKITLGFVIQKFDTEKGFISQEFVAGEADWEDEDGNVLEIKNCPTDYLPFEMVQPEV